MSLPNSRICTRRAGLCLVQISIVRPRAVRSSFQLSGFGADAADLVGATRAVERIAARAAVSGAGVAKRVSGGIAIRVVGLADTVRGAGCNSGPAGFGGGGVAAAVAVGSTRTSSGASTCVAVVGGGAAAIAGSVVGGSDADGTASKPSAG